MCRGGKMAEEKSVEIFQTTNRCIEAPGAPAVGRACERQLKSIEKYAKSVYNLNVSMTIFFVAIRQGGYKQWIWKPS